VANYSVDIELAVKGQGQLKALEQQINSIEQAARKLRTIEVSGATRLTTSELEKQAELYKKSGATRREALQLANRELETERKINEILDKRTALQEKQKKSSQRAESLALGAGFPLLFGGGAGAVAGSIAGSFVGDGFGGQILGSAIGQSIDQAIQKAAQLGSALQTLDLKVLEESGYRVNAALALQVEILKQIGDERAAQIAIEQDILRTTGAIPGTMDGITDAVNVLSAAWADFTAAVSTLLGIIGAPFAAALGALINAVNTLIRGINVIFSSVGAVLKSAGELVVKFIAGDGAVRRMNDGLKANNQELEKARIAFAGILAANNAEILLNREILNLEKQRTLGRTEAEKLINADIDNQQKIKRINTQFDKERYEINQKLTKTNRQLVDQELEQNEVKRRQAIEEANVLNTRTKAVIVATEQEKRDRENTQNLEKQRRELERIAKLRTKQLSDAQDNFLLSEADVSISAAANDEEKIRAEADKTRVQRMITFRRLFSESLSDQERAFLFARQLNEATKAELDTEKALDVVRKNQTRELYSQLGAVDILSTKVQDSLAGAFSSFSNADYKLAFDVPLLLTNGDLSKEIEKVRLELEKLISPANQVSVAAESIGQSFSSSFMDMINGSVSAQQALANFFQATANNFLNMAAQMIAKYIQMQILGLAASFLPGGGLFKGAGPYQFGAGDVGTRGFSLPSILSPRAAGGPVSAGTPYLVGERGPELFMPRSSGSIYPNDALGAGGVQVGAVNITVQNTGENLSPAAQKQIASQVQGIVMATLVNQKRSGGIL
jgi:hypothetical protein